MNEASGHTKTNDVERRDSESQKPCLHWLGEADLAVNAWVAKDVDDSIGST
jgi:hypothetical protein